MRRIERVNIADISVESLQETKTDYLDWQKEQLDQGKKKTGGNITPFYKPATIAIKKRKGQPTDRVTLKDTGFYYDSLYMVIQKSMRTLATVSSDPKSKWLLQKYTGNIMGLGGVYKRGYVSDLRPVFQQKVNNALKLQPE